MSVLFEWGRFDGAAYLDEIEIAWEVAEIPDLLQGTRLTLNRLRKDWSDDDFEALYSRLSRLISPFDDVGDFGIDLLIPAHTDWSGPVQPPQLLEEPGICCGVTSTSAGSSTARSNMVASTLVSRACAWEALAKYSTADPSPLRSEHATATGLDSTSCWLDARWAFARSGGFLTPTRA